MLPRIQWSWASRFLLLLVGVLGACGTGSADVDDVLRDIRSASGNWSARDEWPLAAAMLQEEEFWEVFGDELAEIDPIDPVTGDRWLEDRTLLIPPRTDETALRHFSNWYDVEFRGVGTGSRADFAEVLETLWFGIRDPGAVIADDCQGRLRPAVRECPPLDQYVEEVKQKVGQTGPLEWGLMSEVLVASDPLLGGLIREGYLNTIPADDENGVQRMAVFGRVPFTIEREYIIGNLIIPPFDDAEAMASFGAWFDETFLTDPDSPYYVYVEGPAQAYREMLEETLEFCLDRPDDCGDKRKDLDG